MLDINVITNSNLSIEGVAKWRKFLSVVNSIVEWLTSSHA